MNNKDIIRRYWDARWNRRDAQALASLVHDEVSFRSPNSQAESLEEYLQVYAGLLEVFTDTIVTVEELIEEGDRVSSRVSLRGTHSGDGLGFPASGRRFEVTMLTQFRLDNGSIVEEFQVYDALDLLTQFGNEVGPI